MAVAPGSRFRGNDDEFISATLQETPLKNRDATVAVIGAGYFIGAAIAKKFASEGVHGFRWTAKGREAGAAGCRDRSGGWTDHRALA
jgi:NAD(P)-dependent dehydrogenase (short-subunit alcohol dehydrogenase family)